MEFNSLTQTAYLSASCFSLAFTIACSYQAIKNKVHWSFPGAALVQTLWLGSIAFFGKMPFLNIVTLQATEAAHNVVWLIALLLTTRKYCNQSLPRSYTFLIYSVCLSCCLLLALSLTQNFSANTVKTIILWQGMGLAIFGLLGVEQLYRNVSTVRLIKLICINLAILFIFDAYLFSQNILTDQPSTNIWQARAAAFMATSVLMAIGTISLSQNPFQPAKINVSRPIAFYTTSLIIVGVLLTVLAVCAYYIDIYGGDWGTVVYTILLVLGLSLIALIFLSQSLREKLNVQINKHLFSHKYDYRKEWLRLINKLSQPTSSVNTHEMAINILAELFKCSGGALWLKRGKVMVPSCQVNTKLNISECIEPSSAPFCLIMEQEDWVFSLSGSGGSLTQHNELLPAWVKTNSEFWLILPLLSESSLVGFMILNRPKINSTLNWEDLDLLKTVGRQIAGHMLLREQSEQLSEARQFDAFNKLSAYVMHDLKNLIAQQSLVVKNAEKHKDNPAFIEDTINTINNSVNRMNNLLRKLQHNEPVEAKTLLLRDVLVEAVKGCQKAVPAPTLMTIDNTAKIKADPDSLIMVFTHLINNAQDATPSDGYVDISTVRESSMINIYVEDNGEGMTDEFIQSSLFKPFETTKSGKGMGIGMFQAQEYTQSLGGNIKVESSQGEGTSFIITLPMVEHASG